MTDRSAEREVEHLQGALHSVELEARFTRVYATNLWEDSESISGPGSRVGSEPVSEALDALRFVCREFSITSISDIPCGDLNWIKTFLADSPSITYKGYDIVKPLLERNQQVYPEIACDFLDITRQVPPRTDLVLCKDLIIHLNDDDIRLTLTNIKNSGSKYLLVSNNFGMANSDLREHLHGDSACRYVDIMTFPFRYSPPLWKTSYLGLWELASLQEISA